jgi:hypothetical protein
VLRERKYEDRKAGLVIFVDSLNSTGPSQEVTEKVSVRRLTSRKRYADDMTEFIGTVFNKYKCSANWEGKAMAPISSLHLLEYHTAVFLKDA